MKKMPGTRPVQETYKVYRSLPKKKASTHRNHDDHVNCLIERNPTIGIITREAISYRSGVLCIISVVMKVVNSLCF